MFYLGKTHIFDMEHLNATFESSKAYLKFAYQITRERSPGFENIYMYIYIYIFLITIFEKLIPY